jgi:hypothetical protein
MMTVTNFIPRIILGLSCCQRRDIQPLSGLRLALEAISYPRGLSIFYVPPSNPTRHSRSIPRGHDTLGVAASQHNNLLPQHHLFTSFSSLHTNISSLPLLNSQVDWFKMCTQSYYYHTCGHLTEKCLSNKIKKCIKRK